MIITAGYIVLAAGVVITTIAVISAHKNKYKEKTAELKMIENAGYTKSYEAVKKSNIYRDNAVQKNPSKLRGLSKKSRQILEEIEKEKNEGPVRDTNYEKDILEPLEAKKNNKKYEIKVKTGTDVLITASSENLDKDSRTSSTANPDRKEKSGKEKNKKEKTEEKNIISDTEVLQNAKDNNTEVLTVKKEKGTEVLQNTDKKKEGTEVLEAVREEGTGVLKIDNASKQTGTEVLTEVKKEGTAVLDTMSKDGTAVLKVKSTEGTGVLTTHEQKEGTAVLTVDNSEEGTGVLDTPSKDGTAVLDALPDGGTAVLNNDKHD